MQSAVTMEIREERGSELTLAGITAGKMIKDKEVPLCSLGKKPPLPVYV